MPASGPFVGDLLDQLITRAEDPTQPIAQCSLFIEAPFIIIAQGSDGSVVSALKNLRLSPWSQVGPGATDPALQHYIRNANPSIAAKKQNATSHSQRLGPGRDGAG